MSYVNANFLHLCIGETFSLLNQYVVQPLYHGRESVNQEGFKKNKFSIDSGFQRLYSLWPLSFGAKACSPALILKRYFLIGWKDKKTNKHFLFARILGPGLS
jgi:hypothetical protein